jgi:multidrug transporter EmrE-like cation transporter
MQRVRLKQPMENAIAWLEQATPLVRGSVLVALILVSAGGNVASSVCVKLSAMSGTWRAFFWLQVAGNLLGFVGLITYTALLRFMPLHVGYPLTVGLAAIGVQVLASGTILHESVGRSQWLGTALIILGITLVAARRSP